LFAASVVVDSDLRVLIRSSLISKAASDCSLSDLCAIQAIRGANLNPEVWRWNAKEIHRSKFGSHFWLDWDLLSIGLKPIRQQRSPGMGVRAAAAAGRW
jgi:hypothetical protein